MEYRSNILGVQVDNTSPEAVLRKVQVFIQKRHKFYILTPNPELVLKAQKDKALLKFINKADIAVPDGIGLIAAYEYLKSESKSLIKWLFILSKIVLFRQDLETNIKVIKGRELFLDLIKLANKNGWKVFLVGGEKDEADKARIILEKNYKNIKIVSHSGPVLDSNGDPASISDWNKENEVLDQINKFSPQMLFIGMGAGKQEKWLERNFLGLNTGGAMVVGNTFKFVSGLSRVAPMFISNLGLEWMYRLITGSQNIKRIWNAVPVFIWKVYKYTAT